MVLLQRAGWVCGSQLTANNKKVGRQAGRCRQAGRQAGRQAHLCVFVHRGVPEGGVCQPALPPPHLSVAAPAGRQGNGRVRAMEHQQRETQSRCSLPGKANQPGARHSQQSLPPHAAPCRRCCGGPQSHLTSRPLPARLLPGKKAVPLFTNSS